MAIHNITMRKRNGLKWDTLYPKTLAKNVYADDGLTMQQRLDELKLSQLIQYSKKTVIIEEDSYSIPINLPYDQEDDLLFVFANSVYLEQGIDYRINGLNAHIEALNGDWKATEDSPISFNFIILKANSDNNENIKARAGVGFQKYTLTLYKNQDSIEVQDLIYNEDTDTILLFSNSVYLEEKIDYTIEDKTIKSMNGEWQASSSSPIFFNIVVLKAIPIGNARFDGALIEDNSIDISKISNLNLGLTSQRNTVTLTNDSTFVEIGIEGFDKNKHVLIVYMNGIILSEDEYIISANNKRIYASKEDGSFFAGEDEPLIFNFIVMKACLV